MALGIACAGTGLPAASEILEHLATDSPDFVRQVCCVLFYTVSDVQYCTNITSSSVNSPARHVSRNPGTGGEVCTDLSRGLSGFVVPSLPFLRR